MIEDRFWQLSIFAILYSVIPSSNSIFHSCRSELQSRVHFPWQKHQSSSGPHPFQTAASPTLAPTLPWLCALSQRLVTPNIASLLPLLHPFPPLSICEVVCPAHIVVGLWNVQGVRAKTPSEAHAHQAMWLLLPCKNRECLSHHFPVHQFSPCLELPVRAANVFPSRLCALPRVCVWVCQCASLPGFVHVKVESGRRL